MPVHESNGLKGRGCSVLRVLNECRVAPCVHVHHRAPITSLSYCSCIRSAEHECLATVQPSLRRWLLYSVVYWYWLSWPCILLVYCCVFRSDRASPADIAKALLQAAYLRQVGWHVVNVG